jgi:hypothetical protein
MSEPTFTILIRGTGTLAEIAMTLQEAMEAVVEASSFCCKFPVGTYVNLEFLTTKNFEFKICRN